MQINLGAKNGTIGLLQQSWSNP